MFLGAGLVLTGCGDDDTATTPAPAPPPPPPPAPEPEPEPEPEAPATPTGFHVDVTQTSLSWHWNAVEGALGYVVQVSTDEMFDDTDAITPTTETSFTVADLAPQTTLYARVAAAGGTLEAPILSAWTTHVTGTTDMPPPPPPPPMAPATPTGLMSETGEGSITWSWDAVEGADGYAVQVSTDEMFDDMDETMYTMETSHSVSDLGYGETRYARVASTSGEGEAMLMSMWTTHMTGMSMAEPPPPPPPAPDPVMVEFMIPDGEFPMEPDKDDDAATAMATVNPNIAVSSNTAAIITPMFVDDANGVSVTEGSNMPFGRVSWELLQSDVLSDGATFMVQRAVVGANQEMEPSGDVAYVTCGPFACMEGSDPPEISIANSAACQGWDPELDLQVGRIDNDVVADDTDDTGNDGVDLGMVFKSSLAMKVKHSWSGVANGRNTDTTVDVAKSSTGATMGMNWVMDVIQTDAGPDNDADETGDNIDACDNTYATATGSDSLFEPDGCFRALGPGPAKGAANYLAGWSIELQPQGAGVTWGRVDWDEDPFEDLECESMTMMVGDMVGTDVCDLFEEEVDYAVGDSDDWSPSVIFDTDNRIVRWQATAKNSANDGATPPSTMGKFFKTLWFDDNLNSKIKDDGSADRSATGVADVDALHDLYNQNEDAGNLEWIWGSLRDADGDPMAGDLGKVDMVSEENDADTDVDETATDDNFVHPDGIADNYPEGAAFEDSVRKCTEDDGGDDDDGTICDANWSMTADVAFADGTFGCETTRSVTIKCTWDADGGITTGRGVALPQDFAAATNLSNFLKCEAE